MTYADQADSLRQYNIHKNIHRHAWDSGTDLVESEDGNISSPASAIPFGSKV